MSEEEKLLLDVVSSDPATIATTLKKLLQCGKKCSFMQIWSGIYVEFLKIRQQIGNVLSMSDNNIVFTLS